MDHNLVTSLDAAESLRLSVWNGRQRLRLANAAKRKAKKNLDLVRTSLKPAVARLNDLESGRGSILAELGPATLYEFWIEVPGYSGPVKGAIARLSQHGDIHQVSDVKGVTKGGLGGAVVGGVLFGPAGAIVGAVVRRKTTVNTEFHVVDGQLQLNWKLWVPVSLGPQFAQIKPLPSRVFAIWLMQEDHVMTLIRLLMSNIIL